MKARLPAPAVQSKSKQDRLREYIRETVEQNLDENRTEYARHYMMLMAICLNETEGFGERRLQRVFDALNCLVQGEAPQDEIFWEHVETRCKQLGLSEYFNL